jgi:peptidoglycan/xylan/chitin deacetylase (PgdA/CDA1 family)
MKTYYWSKLKKYEINEPVFVLTADIDSTTLSDKQSETLRNSLRISKEYGVPCWIFVTPDPVVDLERICDRIWKWGGEVIIGCHGLKHTSFSGISYKDQFNQLETSMEIFKKIGIDVFAVRTPWLTSNKYTNDVVSDLGFKFDFSSGFGFPAKLFPFYLRPRRFNQTIYIPLTTPPDVNFRNRKNSRQEISSVWISYFNSIYVKCGVLSYLIHPATLEDVSPIELLLKHATKKNIRFMRKDGISAFK